MGWVIVTGANRGIGFELCRQFVERGDQVVALCRKSSPKLSALGVKVVEGIDVVADGVEEALKERLSGFVIDLLINNAGILSNESLEDLDLAAIRRQFEVNALGPLRVTKALLTQLNRGAKIAIITSRMGSIGDNGSGGHYGYRISKAAVNMVGVNLARDLKSRGISVAILHPGMVATEMTGKKGCSPEESVNGLIARIDGLNLSNTGTFWHANGEILSW